MRRSLACLSMLLTLAACGQKVEATPTPATPAPYQTPVFTQTLTASLIPALTGIFLPTPTTATYTVVQGDTLSSIAQRNGIPLEALLAANPGISATALSVGTKLIIPTGNQTPLEASPTPAAVPVRQAACWPEMTGGLWCFGLAQNDYAETLENLSMQFTLLDSSGKQIGSQVAYGWLDILPAGAAMPLAAHFLPPLPANARVVAQVLMATRLLPGDTRYLPVQLENTLVSVDASGRTAELSGGVLLSGPGTANTLWVLASAYDAAGEVVGVRRWDSPTTLTAQAQVSFDFSVSSLGPAIVKVDFLAEARP